MNDEEYGYVTRTIHKLLDLDLEAYKPKQMRRRLEAFVVNSGGEDTARFCERLASDDVLLTKLRDMITINVSEFFRDFEHFQQLQSSVIPGLLDSRQRLNVWAAGCSHGEEPYSVAMYLEEIAPGAGYRVFATDLDTVVLDQAKAGGPYPKAAIANVPNMYMQKYFTMTEHTYTVVPELRRHVQFRKHNLLSDPYPGGFDLVLCRNVMIYFSDETKDQIFKKFHIALRPGGVLFIGATEALFAAEELGFERVTATYYRRVAAPSSQRKAA